MEDDVLGPCLLGNRISVEHPKHAHVLLDVVDSSETDVGFKASSSQRYIDSKGVFKVFFGWGSRLLVKSVLSFEKINFLTTFRVYLDVWPWNFK